MAEEEITFEEKKYYIDKIMEVLNLESEKDSENKKWLSEIAIKAFATAGSIALMAVVFVGGKVLLGKTEND